MTGRQREQLRQAVNLARRRQLHIEATSQQPAVCQALTEAGVRCSYRASQGRFCGTHHKAQTYGVAL